MERRTYESPMDWEYQFQPPVDQSSPFAKFSQKTPTSSFDSPSKARGNGANPFAIGGASRPGSPLKPQDQPRPPHASFFKPQLQSRPSAPAFRNPAFTTPQKRRDDFVFSPCSDVESSPAMTETSEVPADTPEIEHTREDVAKVTFTPATGRTLFSQTLLRNHASGKGEIARVNRDKVRKRKRLHGDRDVGSVRSRLPHDSDDSDSDWEDPSRSSAKGGRKGKATERSWANNFLSAVSNHPSAPAILSKWLQLGVNVILLSLVLFGIFAILAQIRSDLSHATEKARTALVNEISLCRDHFVKNACSPRGNRPPALDGPCDEWQACMEQDPTVVMVGHLTAKNMAEIMNEFVGVLTLKTWGFILSLFLVAVVASNVGFGFLRESTLAHSAPSAHSAKPAEPVYSTPAVPPSLGPGVHNLNQAYIWAPISQTPRHVRKALFANDATDTDNSPDFKSIMPPPQTPSGRRSPSKGDRNRSPSKGSRGRSPTKGY